MLGEAVLSHSSRWNRDEWGTEWGWGWGEEDGRLLAQTINPSAGTGIGPMRGSSPNATKRNGIGACDIHVLFMYLLCFAILQVLYPLRLNFVLLLVANGQRDSAAR
jgi:hypothetical protein